MTLKKVGGIWFVKLWRLNVSFSMSKPSAAYMREERRAAAYRYQRERMGNRAMARRMAMS